MNFYKNSKIFFLFSLVLLFSCKKSIKNQNLFYLNHSDTVDYVGMDACKNCHYDKYETFKKTGMGQSFFWATKQKSNADFSSNHLVFDSLNNYYYTPFWRNDELFIKEFRLENKDTVYSQTQKIDYIVGSGQHTNSHLIFRNGYLYQVPLTWYSQKKKWDLPPGFEKGKNPRFSRIINDECMSCHNAMPETESKSDFKFKKIGEGIDCERCHGPGELHVNIHKFGKSIKSKNGIDRTIVNPAKLEWDRQVDVCQRCHLQGNAVLKNGKNFFQFKPGMKLSDFYEVYMPEYKNNESDFIMASHVQRLKKSLCFVKSKLTCITCHNPHISVKETRTEVFNNICKNCHNSKQDCNLEEKKLKDEKYNCIKCHMPASGTSDIPHVQIHDHYIRKKISKKTLVIKNEIKGLYCVNNPNPEEQNMIKAYLSYYEKFESNEIYLKKARKILDKKTNDFLEIHYYYLKGDYKKIIEIGKKISKKSINDAWTLYRIGQSFMNLKKWQNAEFYIEKASSLQPLNFEFLYKLSQVKQNLNKSSLQEELLKKVINLNPMHTMALNDIGFFYFKSGNPSLALSYYQRSYNTNPDFIPVLKNLFDYYLSINNMTKAKLMAKIIIKKEPKNEVLNKFLEK